MIILTFRTDKPEAEIGIFNGQEQLAYYKWQAHRELAETIHLKINKLLEQQQLTLKDINGIAVYQGPGSFTGLRIGLSVANALAASLKIPIISAKGEDWLVDAIDALENGEDEKQAMPEYGSPPNITRPKH